MQIQLDAERRARVGSNMQDFQNLFTALEDENSWHPAAAATNLRRLDKFQQEFGEQMLVLRWYLNEAAHPKT